MTTTKDAFAIKTVADAVEKSIETFRHRAEQSSKDAENFHPDEPQYSYNLGKAVGYTQAIATLTYWFDEVTK